MTSQIYDSDDEYRTRQGKLLRNGSRTVLRESQRVFLCTNFAMRYVNHEFIRVSPFLVYNLCDEDNGAQFLDQCRYQSFMRPVSSYDMLRIS